MIYIRVELWPHGNRERMRLLGEATIANTGDSEDRANVGNYDVRLLNSPEYANPGNEGKVWMQGRVEGFPRKRLGPWDLLFRALMATVGRDRRRNPEVAP